MHSLINRYLSALVLRMSFYVLVGLLGLYVFFDLIGELGELGKGSYTLVRVLSYVALSIPQHTYELLPIAALIGGLFALGLLNQYSEYTVMRTSGISVRRLLGILLLTGFVLSLLTALLGEYIAPWSERKAKQLRIADTGRVVVDGTHGFWFRDGPSFVNVREVLPDQETLQDIHIHRFDAQQQLVEYDHAQRGVWKKAQRGWALSGLVRTTLGSTRVTRRADPDFFWQTVLTPETLSVLLIPPEQMSITVLVEYIQHLARNQQQTGRYEIALWGKLIYPLGCLAMLMIALPFSQTQHRTHNLGMRLFFGIALGLGFYLANRLTLYVGLLRAWWPLLTAALPFGVLFLTSVWLLWRQERR